MLIGEQPVLLDRGQHFGKERVSDIALEQTVAVLRERRGIPHRIVHAEPHEPAVENAVVQLLYQQPLAANAVQHLQQQRAKELLGGNRGPARRRIQLVEAGRQPRQCRVRHAPNRPQRMIGADPLLRRDIAKHRLVSRIVASHPDAPFVTVGSIVVRRDQHVDPLRVTFSAPC
jgi:hypothetical protein